MSNVPYFKSKEIAPRTWLIEYAFTPRGGVLCYLLEGENYALVIDTMNGQGNLKTFCQTLTDKPLKLVNTHFHIDHVSGNFDFDACYMHHADIKYFYDFNYGSQEQLLEQAKHQALPEYQDQMEAADMCAYRDMRVYPLYDGDVFDLGDRQIEVIHVGGHSPGSIVLLDRANRIAFTGDACNGNTLLGFGNALPIEEYLGYLLHFHRFQDAFDIMYGGHQIMDPCTIDEGIETCGKVLAGTDDHEERPGMFGAPSIYAAAHAAQGFGRADGKSFNMNYNPDKRFGRAETRQVITMAPNPMF